MHSCVTSSGWPCHSSGMGLDDLQRSLQTLTLLWFCDFSTALWLLHHSCDDQGLKVLCVIVDHFLCHLWVTELQATQLARENFSAWFLILRGTLGTTTLSKVLVALVGLHRGIWTPEGLRGLTNVLGRSLAGIYQLERLVKQSLRSNILTQNLLVTFVIMCVFKSSDPDLQAVLLWII